MRIAVFLHNDNLKVLNKDAVQAFTFDVNNDLIISIGQETLITSNLNSVSLWLLNKSIEEIYITTINSTTKCYLERIGITVRSMDELKDNPILKSFVIQKKTD